MVMLESCLAHPRGTDKGVRGPSNDRPPKKGLLIEITGVVESQKN